MNDESDGRAAAGRRRFAAWAEVLATTALFAAWGAWPAPDVNEAVYLTKARHAADPAWGRGDFFLETADAHPVFYMLAGPLAAGLPLEQAAWIGRILGWLALAVGFRHAVLPLLGTASLRLAAAATFALALEQTTAAGEWVIGGCESKVYAWAFVLGAVGELVRGRFAGAACLMGAGTALHPVVGGWGFAAAAITWLVGGRPRPARLAPVAIGLVAAGVGLALVGVVPALGLSAGADAALRAEGARIHVVERLPHHLLPRGFAAGMTARHVLAAIAWWLLARAAPPTPPRARLATFTLVAVGIALAGHAIALAEPWAPAPVHGLLRYYWFRLADVAVAFALATAALAVLGDDAACRRVLPFAPRVARLSAGLLLAAAVLLQAWHWPLPGRSPPVSPRADAKVEAAAWADVCRWVDAQTPADACFLTPRGAASFGWRTGRREVVSWKNSPQDAAALVAWRARIVDCFSRDGGMVNLERSPAAIGPGRMREVASRYGADHAIVPVELAVAGLPGERLYANDRYVVLRLAP